MQQLVSPSCLKCFRADSFDSGKLGHVKRRCPDEIIPIEQVTITCALCGEAGESPSGSFDSPSLT